MREKTPNVLAKVHKSEEQWQAELSEAQFQICRLKGTEPAFSGCFWNHHEQGTYHCACCHQPLFSSHAKYDSGSGWPSYFQPISMNSLCEKKDSSHGMERIEVCCAACDAHLGHVFDDGPAPTGQRYCINSLALTFKQSQ